MTLPVLFIRNLFAADFAVKSRVDKLVICYLYHTIVISFVLLPCRAFFELEVETASSFAGSNVDEVVFLAIFPQPKVPRDSVVNSAENSAENVVGVSLAFKNCSEKRPGFPQMLNLYEI